MRQLAVTKCRLHREMWEMLAGLIVWPWQEPVFELTVYGNYRKCFGFFWGGFFWSVLGRVRTQTKHWQHLIWKCKAYAFCLYRRVLTCLSLPSLTPCSFLNEIDPVFNDSSSCFGVAPKRITLHRFMQYFISLPFSFVPGRGMWVGNPRLLVCCIKSNMSRNSV